MFQLIWSTVLASHLALAVAWWRLMPGGFPSSSTEFWVNQVAPAVPFALAALAIVGQTRSGAAIFAPLLTVFPLFWMSFAISARLTFPSSIGGGWNIPFFAGVLLSVMWARQFHRSRPRAWLLLLFGVPAIWAGWVAPSSQRAGEPATSPTNLSLPEVPAGASEPRFIRLTKDAQIHPSDGRVVIRRDQLVLTVQPMLSFADRSPDRFWTTFADPPDNKATNRRFASVRRDGARWLLAYRDEDLSVLDVGIRDGAIDIDSRSRLPQPVFSHLNRFAEVTIVGHRRLSVSFSPAPSKRIEIPAASAPARFAYLDATRSFHVVQASSEQKGPFTELAAGPLRAGEPLVMTLYDGDAVAFRISLDDWAAQASTQLSPAAGWAIPVNDIELSRVADPENAPAQITLSLAATGVGRGSESVGHAAGVYRNRVSVTVPRPSPP